MASSKNNFDHPAENSTRIKVVAVKISRFLNNGWFLYFVLLQTYQEAYTLILAFQERIKSWTDKYQGMQSLSFPLFSTFPLLFPTPHFYYSSLQLVLSSTVI